MRFAFDPVPMRPGETLAQYLALPSHVQARRQDEVWSAGRVESMPAAWAQRLLARWRGRYHEGRAAANLEHLRATGAILAAQRAGVRADATDADLCEEARQSARDMGRRLDQRETIERGRPEGVRLLAAWAEVWHWLEARGLTDWARRLLRMRTMGAAVLARVRCDRWWRRVLRTVQARGIEATARGLGMVHRGAACYVSDDGVRQRAQQRARNEAALQATRAMNETGQAYTLADLAAAGVSNKAIRRQELMARIAGFEAVAKDCGHLALFVTLTCPSRMHRMRTAGPRVEENPRWDGTAPDEAQQHLCSQWAKARAAADRAGVAWYGFRIVEPNHDGTPHWHALLFMPTEAKRGPADAQCIDILRRYFLDEVDPHEPGAAAHRVTVERIDWARGSAAGYVAKYVAKNIDGYRVDRDLFGNDAMSSAQRVEAWAARWRIRQFQQIGGPPVGVWRELRRVHPAQAEAGPGVDLALHAVNLAKLADEGAAEELQRYTAAHAWATYAWLQGGPTARRVDHRVTLFRERREGATRYGEPLPARAVGVSMIERQATYRPAFGIVPESVSVAPVRVQVESERQAWRIVGPGFDFSGRGEATPPWSPVNNCTDAMRPGRADPALLLFAGIVRRSKVGQSGFGGWRAPRKGIRHGFIPGPDRPDRRQRRPGTGDGTGADGGPRAAAGQSRPGDRQ